MVEWIEKPIGELFTISGGRSASRAQLSDRGYFYLHYGDIHSSTKSYIDTDEDKTVIPHLNVSLNKVSTTSLLMDGDVVFVDASEDDIGASKHVVVRNKAGVPFIAGLHTIIAKPLTDETDKAYREYCFQTADVVSQFKYYATGTKVTGISKTSIKNIKIRFPESLPEQWAIAAALSDADGYIVSLERLIAKKHDIKQGAMQELLRAREGWVEKTLGELCSVKDGTHQTPHYVGYGIPFYSVENITNGDFSNVKYISLEEHKRLTSSFRIERNDVLMTRIGSIGVCKYIDWDVNASFYVSLALLKCNDNIDARFLCALSQTEAFKKEILLHSLQHAIPQKINLANISLVRVSIPTLPEQTRIAEILSDMDSEIKALTAKLTKAKLIKQGMMQELLTGHIRLMEVKTAEEIVPEVKATPAPVTKLKPVAAAKHGGHNPQFDDAVAFAVIVDKFYNPQFTLGRVRMYKLLYLFRRHQEAEMAGFTKKAAGPYKSDARYAGGEKIAKENDYIIETKLKEGFAVSKGKDISIAIKYADDWQWQDTVNWLVSEFKLTKTNDLETLATVDMAACELREAGKAVDLHSIKEVIRSNNEWKPKLSKLHFTDAKIVQAIKRSKELFG